MRVRAHASACAHVVGMLLILLNCTPRQDFLAAKEVGEMLAEEMGPQGNKFEKRRAKHLQDLEVEELDYVMSSIGAFI